MTSDTRSGRCWTVFTLETGWGGFEGGMTARQYVRMTNASKATVTRDLAALEELGCQVP